MTTDPLHDAILAWIDKSGRALELRVARSLSSTGHPLHVNQSMHYQDVETQQQREGDVLAVYRWNSPAKFKGRTSLDVTVECKGGTSHPWVAFYDDRRFISQSPDEWFFSHNDSPPSLREETLSVWLEQESLQTDRVATHAVSALGADGKNFVRDATLQALSFAKARARLNLTYAADAPGLTASKIAVPVVVTAAPLFACELLSSGELLLKRVERFDLLVPSNQWKRRRVYVRSEAALNGMAEAFTAVQEHFGPARDA